jgi:hypothetical protein
MTPKLYIENYPSRERVKEMGRMLAEAGGSLPDDFDINEISWVTPRIGITDFEGSIDAVAEGYLTINVAGELDSPAQVQIAVEPYHGNVKETLRKLAYLINDYLYGTDDENTKVVVHCAMGIERSPLTVVWYLHKYMCLTLDEAYALVREARPVAVERRYWIEGYEDTEGNI